MNYHIITLFPYFFNIFFKTGMMYRAVKNNLINYKVFNLRKYGIGKHKKVDDIPYGGGEGMLLQNQPLKECIKQSKYSWKICLTPRGEKFNSKLAKELANQPSLTLICGHYEGIDQRFINQHVDQEISLGDYVLYQGETAAMVIMEVVSRYLEGFLGNKDSAKRDSYENGILENDQYTRPYDEEIPSVLLSGNHREIKKWKKNNQLWNTLIKRPDLFKKIELSLEEENNFKEYFYSNLKKIKQPNLF